MVYGFPSVIFAGLTSGSSGNSTPETVQLPQFLFTITCGIGTMSTGRVVGTPAVFLVSTAITFGLFRNDGLTLVTTGSFVSRCDCGPFQLEDGKLSFCAASFRLVCNTSDRI